MTGAFLVDWVGRRPLFIISTAGMLTGEYGMPSQLFDSASLPNVVVAFCMWTLTTALFEASHNTAAAKGTSDALHSLWTLTDLVHYQPPFRSFCEFPELCLAPA
jgi:hypothetical protein